MSKAAPFGTDDQPKYETRILGGRSVLRPIEANSAKAERTSQPEKLSLRSRGGLAVDAQAVVGSLRQQSQSAHSLALDVLPPISPGRGVDADSVGFDRELDNDIRGDDLLRLCKQVLAKEACAKRFVEALDKSFQEKDTAMSGFLPRAFVRDVLTSPPLSSALGRETVDALLDRCALSASGTAGEDVEYGSVVRLLRLALPTSNSGEGNMSKSGARLREDFRVAPLPQIETLRPSISLADSNSTETAGNNETSLKMAPNRLGATAALMGMSIRKNIHSRPEWSVAEVDGAQEKLELLPSNSEHMLQSRRDAKLIAALERDWTATAGSSVNTPALFDLESFQTNLAELDTSRSGCLSSAEVLRIARNHHVPVSIPTLEQLLKRCDCENDGNIRWIELVDFLEQARPVVLLAKSAASETGSCSAKLCLPSQVLPLGSIGISHSTSDLEYWDKTDGREEIGCSSEKRGVLASASTSSLLDIDVCQQGLLRLRAAMVMSAENIGCLDYSAAERLCKTHNVVYQLGLTDGQLNKLLGECIISSSRNEKSSSSRALRSRSLSTLARRDPVGIESFISALANHLGVSEPQSMPLLDLGNSTEPTTS